MRIDRSDRSTVCACDGDGDWKVGELSEKHGNGATFEDFLSADDLPHRSSLLMAWHVMYSKVPASLSICEV
jgi:hypothetical protein